MYQRTCPKCKKELSYTNKSNRNVAEKANRLCRNCSRKEVCQRPESKRAKEILAQRYREEYKGEGNPFYGKTHTKETKERIQQNRDSSFSQTPEYREKMSQVTSGQNNPMHGKNIYDIWVDKYGEDEADKRMASLAKKRSKNMMGEKNPMYGKSPPKGAGNGWGGWHKGWYFRSLKELSYMVYVIEPNGYKWESAERKHLSMPYVDHLGHKRTYRADFLLNDSILIEVKPKALMDTAVNQQKKAAAEIFCSNNGYEYRMVDVKTIEYKALRSLCASGVVKLSDPSRLKNNVLAGDRRKR